MPGVRLLMLINSSLDHASLQYN